jgi:hypothetical protein
MKIAVTSLVLIVGTSVGASVSPAQTTSKTGKASSKPAATSQVVTIPKDAVKDPDANLWRYTDKDGKKWTYTTSPFGVIKTAVDDSTNKPVAPPPVKPKAIDKGDSVAFERPTPFGPMKWEKKKTDLTEEERQLFESQNPPKESKPEAK